MFRLETNGIDLVVGQVYLIRITKWVKYKQDEEFQVALFYTGERGGYPCFSSVVPCSAGTFEDPYSIDGKFYENVNSTGTVTVESALARKPQVNIRGAGYGS